MMEESMTPIIVVAALMIALWSFALGYFTRWLGHRDGQAKISKSTIKQSLTNNLKEYVNSNN
jgi:hypothetical protein